MILNAISFARIECAEFSIWHIVIYKLHYIVIYITCQAFVI